MEPKNDKKPNDRIRGADDLQKLLNEMGMPKVPIFNESEPGDLESIIKTILSGDKNKE